MALDPVVRTALAVLLDRLTIGTRCAIQLHAVAHNRAQAEHLRAVRILGGFAAGMMLAMNGSPLAGNHRGAQPGPEAEKVRQHGMEIDAAMGLAADRKSVVSGQSVSVSVDLGGRRHLKK